MTYPSYPSELPNVLTAGYRRSFADGRFKSRNDGGPADIGSRFSVTYDPIQASTQVSLAQRGTFERFFVEMTKRGAVPFWIPDHTSDGAAWLDENYEPVLFEDFRPVTITEILLVQFTTLPDFVPRDMAWTISFGLEILPIT
ncbi:hypothetical protein BZU93_27690 [Salmonella enterica subsp. enterica]|nr:hypothetical protein [Salmonella enterica subsp. enterica serovar Enteritidis]